MKIRNISLTTEQGSGAAISANQFFNRTKVNATGFLDYYEGLQVGARKKSEKFWKRLKEGAPLISVLEHRKHNQTGMDYCWIEVGLFRGKESYFVVLFTTEMFDFLVEYHEGRTMVNFTLQELLDEASRLESLELNGSKED